MRQRIINFLEDLQDLHDRWADRGSRIKVAKIRRVFAREGGLISGMLSSSSRGVCGHPGRCAMGALLVAAGMSDSELWLYGLSNAAYRLAQKKYGLSENDVDDIISANDGYRRKQIWKECGINTRPQENVRVCVVNDRVRELASA